MTFNVAFEHLVFYRIRYIGASHGNVRHSRERNKREYLCIVFSVAPLYVVKAENRFSRHAEVDLSQPIRRKKRSAAGEIGTLK